jgi:hypothetical protein
MRRRHKVAGRIKAKSAIVAAYPALPALNRPDHEDLSIHGVNLDEQPASLPDYFQSSPARRSVAEKQAR